MMPHTGPETAFLAGVPYGTLQYWWRTGLVPITLRRPTGRGSKAICSISDVRFATLVRALRIRDVPLQHIRYLALELHRISDNSSFADGSKLVVTDVDAVVLSDPDGLLEYFQQIGLHRRRLFCVLDIVDLWKRFEWSEQPNLLKPDQN
jgi:DNA-binding transcriptional MerR regulator